MSNNRVEESKMSGLAKSLTALEKVWQRTL